MLSPTLGDRCGYRMRDLCKSAVIPVTTLRADSYIGERRDQPYRDVRAWSRWSREPHPPTSVCFVEALYPRFSTGYRLRMRWQLHPRSGERSGLVTAMGWMGCAVLCGTLAACSFVLDSKANQCEVDSDCNDLIKTGHPVCQSG